MFDVCVAMTGIPDHLCSLCAVLTQEHPECREGICVTGPVQHPPIPTVHASHAYSQHGAGQ